MKTCSAAILSLVVLLAGSSILFGEPVVYVKDGRRFSIHENSGKYVVECVSTTSAPSSRNRNLTDRRYRIEAVDLIGAYILFRQSEFRSDGDLFQIFADATQLHYQAYLNDLEQEDRYSDGKPVTVYRCRKENYNISAATYRKDLDLHQLLKENYRRRKDEPAIALMARYGALGLSEWLMVERDFLTGGCSLPQLARKLQSVPDRLERSMIMADDPVGKYSGQIPENPVYRVLFLEEMVTSLPLSRKKEAYRDWIKSLGGVDGPIPELLRFCTKVCPSVQLPEEPVFTEMIEAFPGALSPFGVRTPMDSRLYDEAVKAYSGSDFAGSLDLLTTYVNENGLSPSALNLLGASLRYLGKSSRSLPYLILCMKLAPGTPYVAGNLILALKDLSYPHLDEMALALHPLTVEDWSRKEVEKLIGNTDAK